MSGSLHRELQEELVQLGNKLGFLARMEFPLENLFPGYSPVIDVVWFYPLSESQSDAIKKTHELWPYWEGSTALYPYAAFEITASDATSKTVMSEIWNMKLSGFRYAFKIVPIQDPKHPDYIHKERAERINRTLSYFSGISDVFVASIEELQNAIRKVQNLEVKRHVEKPLKFRTPKLRDNPHNKIVKHLAKIGESHGFTSVIEYTPRWLKNIEKRVTFIRHDVVWLSKLPASTEVQFKEFLRYLSANPIRDVSPIEVLAFEVETGVFDKHSIGSVLNLVKICGRGVLVVENKKAELAETVRMLSSNTVDTRDFSEICPKRNC